MNKSDSILTSVIGKQLIGESKSPARENTNMSEEIILPGHNHLHAILKDNAKCTIYVECSKDPDYYVIRQKLLLLNIKLLEVKNEIIEGNRIFCEYDKEIRKEKKSKRNACVIKGKYVLGTISKVLRSPGSIYYAGDRIIPNTNWNGLIISENETKKV